jgi:hypothetical protein
MMANEMRRQLDLLLVSLLKEVVPSRLGPDTRLEPWCRARRGSAATSRRGADEVEGIRPIFSVPEWRTFWEAEIMEIFRLALELRADMDSQGGEYCFVWPEIGAPLVTAAGAQDDQGARVLLPMLS